MYQAPELPPQPRTFAIQACTTAGHGHVLAGESSAENIDSWELVTGHLADIGVLSHIWPVASQHRAALVVDLDLPQDPQTSAL